MVKVTALPSDGLLLDAAGGTGRVAKALKPFVKEVFVADLSKGMLSQAMNKNLKSVQTPVEVLPFAPETFDRIIMVDALHHVNNQAESISDLWRVLKGGGCMVIEEPDVRTWQVKILAFMEKLILMQSHFKTPPQILQLVPPEAQVEHFTDGINSWLIAWKQ